MKCGAQISIHITNGTVQKIFFHWHNKFVRHWSWFFSDCIIYLCKVDEIKWNLQSASFPICIFVAYVRAHTLLKKKKNNDFRRRLRISNAKVCIVIFWHSFCAYLCPFSQAGQNVYSMKRRLFSTHKNTHTHYYTTKTTIVVTITKQLLFSIRFLSKWNLQNEIGGKTTYVCLTIVYLDRFNRLQMRKEGDLINVFSFLKPFY